MEIHIKTIPDSMMRLPGGVGDYWYDREGVLQVRVVELGDDFMATMVATHEIVEEALTKRRGLSEPEIQTFDEYYEMRRKQGLVPENSEPGYDINCPYAPEHCFAESIERGMCAMAGLPWVEYENKINSI